MPTQQVPQPLRARRLRGFSPAWGLAAAAVLVAVAAGACSASAAPPASTSQGRNPLSLGQSAAVPEAAASAAPAGLEDNGQGFVSGGPADVSNPTTPPDQAVAQLATTDQKLIVRTGQMSLEVSDIDAATAKAQVTIDGMGGYVSESSRYGEGDSLGSIVTYRIPVADWDAALAAFHKLANKVLSEQTSSNDVTTQAADLDARLANLASTESALQAIMARASAIPDVLDVEQQLSDTQGQIEQLQAERKTLGNQAALSTLTVTYQLKGTPVATVAAQGWTLGDTEDQAVAQLIKIGQGVATAAVWLVIVGVPVVFGLLIALGILWLVSRRFGRARRRSAAS